MKMEVKFEKAVNHHEEVRKILHKADKFNMSPMQILNEYILDELIPTLDPTKQMLIEQVMKIESHQYKIEMSYNEGIETMAQEIKDMIEYIQERIQK